LAAGVNLNFLNLPTLTGGIIGGFATVNSSQDWATLSGSTVGAYSAYTPVAVQADLDAAGTNDNVNDTSATDLAISASKTINSFKLSGGGGLSIASGQTLTVGAGGILVPTGTSPTISGPGAITAGTTQELDLILPSSATTLTIGAQITDNGGGAVAVVKNGPGALTLSNTSNSFTGGLAILAGSLKLGGANSI